MTSNFKLISSIGSLKRSLKIKAHSKIIRFDSQENMDMDTILHVYILLAATPDKLDCEYLQKYDTRRLQWGREILDGLPHLVVKSVLQGKSPLCISQGEDEYHVLNSLREFCTQFSDGKEALLLAIAFLQTFIQNNYTGPCCLNRIEEIQGVEKNVLINLLSSDGQPAYGLMESPLFLLLSLILLEQITQQPSILGDNSGDDEVNPTVISVTNIPSLLAVAHWWRARAVLAHSSLLSEPSGSQSTVIASTFESIELVNSIVKDLPTGFPEFTKKNLYTIFYLENVKSSLAISTEHLCLPTLIKVQKLTHFEFVLTGARSLRTKFQRESHSGLVILAESSFESLENEKDEPTEALPENLTLNSDTLLEKTHFESIGDVSLDEQVAKSRKMEGEIRTEENYELFPISLRQEDIPSCLRALDPNSQPRLSNYDEIQLLLRLYVLRQISPAKDPMVEEQLGAIIYRIIHQEGPKNYSIFSRALWERSVIETLKARTVERGLLQMQALVEELGLRVGTHLTCENPSSRLKYVHQLPFIPRWELDALLAEKYMSLGVLRSAVEIYQRLHMACEAALCYAAVGDEKEADTILSHRINENPRDARALSILGDVRQDPTLWEQSWKIGKYGNAKNSLARYYYNPPRSSGLTKDLGAVLKHLNDSLRRYPLNFEGWYFYGCAGLESGKLELAAEAFSRCVSLDPTHGKSWSNLAAAYVELRKLKEAFSCLKRAISTDARKNWRIWENYMLVAIKLNEWNDVLLACKNLVTIRKEKTGEAYVDVPVVEKLVELLVSTKYQADSLSYYQRSCIDFVCNTIPSIATNSARCWRIVAKVELWRQRPWAALDCYEKAYRAISHNPDLATDETIWKDAVDACDDLVAAYESLGEMEGRHGPGSYVCPDWKYKSRAAIKTLISKGKGVWEDSNEWERLLEMRRQL